MICHFLCSQVWLLYKSISHHAFCHPESAFPCLLLWVYIFAFWLLTHVPTLGTIFEKATHSVSRNGRCPCHLKNAVKYLAVDCLKASVAIA